MKNIQNMSKDPSFFEMVLKDPKNQAILKKYPVKKLFSQNPEIFLNPQYKLFFENMFKKNENNSIENSISKNIVPPEPFGSLNNIQNVNSVNNSSNEIEIDYKEKYKEELSKLKSMGFNNEETNIQALKQSNGNFENVINMLLEQNN